MRDAHAKFELGRTLDHSIFPRSDHSAIHGEILVHQGHGEEFSGNRVRSDAHHGETSNHLANHGNGNSYSQIDIHGVISPRRRRQELNTQYWMDITRYEVEHKWTSTTHGVHIRHRPHWAFADHLSGQTNSSRRLVWRSNVDGAPVRDPLATPQMGKCSERVSRQYQMGRDAVRAKLLPYSGGDPVGAAQ
ncbi:hypothetical protein BH24CHL3_BH24CHL3_03950 [soil metagenome]